MSTLRCSRTKLRNLIYVEKKLREAPRQGGNTSPIWLYEADVVRLAEEWGLL